MCLQRMGRTEEGLEIAEGLMKKDIGNAQFKALAKQLVEDSTGNRVERAREAIEAGVAKNDEQAVRKVAEENLPYLRRILVDSGTLDRIVDSLWDRRKVTVIAAAVRIYLYLLDRCLFSDAVSAQSIPLRKLSAVLAYSRDLIPQTAQLIAKSGAVLNDSLLAFAVSLLNSSGDGTAPGFPDLCSLLLIDSPTVNPPSPALVREAYSAFLDKFADRTGTEDQDKCLGHISVLGKLCGSACISAEVRPEDFQRPAETVPGMMRSLSACAVYAQVDPKSCAAFLAEHGALVKCHVDQPGRKESCGSGWERAVRRQSGIRVGEVSME